MSRPPKRALTRNSNAGLEKKLAKYLIAGGAILAGPLPLMSQTATDGSPVLVSFPGGPSFELTVGPNDLTGNYASVTGTSVTFLEGAGGLPAALTFGSLITAANADGPGGYLSKYGATSSMTSGFKSGNWPQSNGGSAYLGLAFTVSGQTYAGWALIATSVNEALGSGSAQLISYAYETTPGGSIDAGVTPTPEPSSLALFAMGGGALLELLRRRRAAQLN
jgi:hypothetical protein